MAKTRELRQSSAGTTALGPLPRPLPPSTPKAVKRTAGRVLPPPAHVRVFGVNLADRDRQLIRQKLGARLRKFERSIERVSVRVKDVNGPRGGVDQLCRIKVVLSGLPSIVVEERHASTRGAIEAGVDAADRAVRRAVSRRRMKPLHRRNVRQAVG